MDATDKELFDAAMSDAPAQETAPESTAEQTPEQAAIARDEQGRFAPKAADETAPEQIEEQPQAEGQPPEQATRPGFVPSSRLKEEADARRAEKERADRLETLLTQMVQKQTHPAPAATDPTPKAELWDDPDQWVDGHIGTVKTEVQQTREFFSRKFAEQVHGADKVKEAYAALDAAVGKGEMNRDQVLSQLQKSMDPYGDIMGWYEASAPQRDPESYKQKIIADYLASQGGQAAPQAQAGQQAPSSVVRIPTSLNRTTSGAPNTPAGGDGDMSDASLFANAMRK
jgi:hypothetical protein